jgi:hypothetical protein
MNFSEMDGDERMALRAVIESAGGHVAGYQGPGVQVAIPAPRGPLTVTWFIQTLRDVGLNLCGPSLHYFPLGSDNPEATLRHDGPYPGCQGYWLLGRFDVDPERTPVIARALLAKRAQFDETAHYRAETGER